MPYCRKCGAELEPNAHFCQKCGTSVQTYAYTPTYTSSRTDSRPIRKDPLIMGAIILVTILIAGVIVAAVLAAPFSNINVNESYKDNHADVNQLNLNFQADTAQVNVITQDINNYNILIAVQAEGSTGLFGNNNNPIAVTFDNQTANGVLTVTSTVKETTALPRLRLVCNIYVNPALQLNLNVTSKTGQVSLTADKLATFQSLNLQTTTGEVQANIQNATIAGNITLRAQTGSIYYRMYQTNIQGNNSLTLDTTTGTIGVEITQTKTLQGNLDVKTQTDLGSINLDLTIDGNIGAQIASKTNLGNIHVNQNNFSGEDSLIKSDNYPAQHNITVDNTTNLGSININASYETSTGPTIAN